MSRRLLNTLKIAVGSPPTSRLGPSAAPIPKPAGGTTIAGETSATAAVEFALIVPVFALLVVYMLDFSYAYYIKLRLVIATSAAAQYAFVNGQSLTASGIPSFRSNVQAIAAKTASLPVAPTVSVLVNNAPDASLYYNNYCVTGSPPTWYSTMQAVVPCTSGVTSGKFVTIKVSTSTGTLFSSDPVVGSMVSLSDSAIVRIQ